MSKLTRAHSCACTDFRWRGRQRRRPLRGHWYSRHILTIAERKKIVRSLKSLICLPSIAAYGTAIAVQPIDGLPRQRGRRCTTHKHAECPDRPRPNRTCHVPALPYHIRATSHAKRTPRHAALVRDEIMGTSNICSHTAAVTRENEDLLLPPRSQAVHESSPKRNRPKFVARDVGSGNTEDMLGRDVTRRKAKEARHFEHTKRSTWHTPPSSFYMYVSDRLVGLRLGP
ncbi:hypothetical protein OE88DRAFT_1228129 [Heliocybe sulcata]|uniref:Uncharacterized protein n=1 Tax=Heliocybe sulcata TaxID=5364 RepID=A0A5C3MLY7_9AGAM|nr:hypothetical protein OE88DRAFT_1228129 [Heliocybe sulcata]